MKTALFFLLLTLTITASQFAYTDSANDKVILTGTRFTYPIIEKWIAEFKKVHPDVNVSLAPLGSAAADSANVRISGQDVIEKNLNPGETHIALAKYGLLAIANAKSPLVASYKNKGLQESDINKLFFMDHISTSKEKEYVVYTREQKSCAPVSFASSYGHTFEELAGTKVKGDDKALLNALRADSLGISYNNLGYVYDVKNRKLVDGIAVLPFDLNHNGRVDADEKFYNSLDEVIAKYETTTNKLLATEEVSVIYSTTKYNAAIDLFLNWVLTDGQKYNHELGFLNFNAAELNQQKLAFKNGSTSKQ
jgi:phosphate transport system substrate-binding protein